MKTLLILRHAKAEPGGSAGDRARALTERGRRDAAAVGARLLTLVGRPDAIVTSDARRALQTAELVAEATGFAAPLTLEPRVYATDPIALLQVVRGLQGDADRVLLVGHNPGLSELASALAAADAAPVHLPTAGLAHLEFAVARWDEVRPGGGHWRGLTTPGDRG